MAKVEFSYLLEPKGRLTKDLDKRFKRLSRFAKNLCKICDADCEGFVLTTASTEYDHANGPKIGWSYYGDTILLRVANCESPDSIRKIEEFIEKDGFKIIKITGPQLI